MTYLAQPPCIHQSQHDEHVPLQGVAINWQELSDAMPQSRDDAMDSYLGSKQAIAQSAQRATYLTALLRTWFLWLRDFAMLRRL
jgi:hypothetical protein